MGIHDFIVSDVEFHINYQAWKARSKITLIKTLLNLSTEIYNTYSELYEVDKL